MAEQKVDPNRPKDDKAGTAFQPLATPAVDEKGEALPLGPDTLEAQRTAWQEAEQKLVEVSKDNPLETQGVDADIQNAEQNPSQSGPTDVKKEDVAKQGEVTKKAVAEQNKEVKSKQEAGVKTQATVTAEKTGVGVGSSTVSSAQPHPEATPSDFKETQKKGKK